MRLVIDDFSLPIPIPEGLKIAIFIPDREISTKLSRKVLPRKVPIEDAVKNIGRASLLLASFFSNDLSLLKIASEDFIHQPYRKKLMPWMEDIFKAALSSGAYGAFLCGGGSSVGAFVKERAGEVSKAMEEEAERLGIKGKVIISSPSQRGACEDNSPEIRG